MVQTPNQFEANKEKGKQNRKRIKERERKE